MNTWRILCGDVREKLAELPAGSVRTCVTSPPYWGLRDYGVAGQIGLESTPEAYVAAMVAVFREVRRVLADDGTVWLNLGDSYSGGGNYRGINSTNTLAPKQASNRGARGLSQALGALGKETGCKDKDLVGIPWMVAFALRAPHVHHVITDAVDRAWLAALVDGEGTMTILETESPHGSGNSYPPVLQVRMCDVECIAKAATITGYGKASPRQDPPSQGGVRGSYQWRLNGQKAARIAADIYPYLCIKRKQAIVIWNHQQVRDSYETKKGQPIPRAAVEKQQMCRDLIRRINKRESVDIPHWMVEPTVEVTPGWYLRSDVIWSKPNPMPESVTDRPTKAHEYIFLLSKSKAYYYDAAAIAERGSDALRVQTDQGYDGAATKDYAAVGVQNPSSVKARIIEGKRRAVAQHKAAVAHGDAGYLGTNDPFLTRNKRTVWTVTTQPYADAHFATFPEKLIEPCILAGSAFGDTVLDPFTGSGTTGAVAIRHQRNFIGCELNPAYVELARKRIHAVAPMFAQEVA